MNQTPTRTATKATIMSRTPALAPVLTILLLAQAGAVLAQSTPSDTPPKLERIEEGSDTPITVTPPRGSERKITEKKEGGRTTEVVVKSGKSTYIMRPHVPAGNAQPGDGQTGAIRAPQWKVMEFDLGKKKKTDQEEGASDAAPAAAPPPPPPAAK
jgi:hypothetical protein